MKLEMPESFEEVAVKFSREEWKMLSKEQKALHREVMLQNYENMVSVGYNIPVKRLWSLISKDETVPSLDDEGGLRRLWSLISKDETVPSLDDGGGLTLPNNSISIIRIADFPEIHKKHHNCECDKALTNNKMTITWQNLRQTETRHHKCLERKAGVIKETKLGMTPETCARERKCKRHNGRNISLRHSNSVSGPAVHSKPRQKNRLATHDNISVREKLYECTTCGVSFTCEEILALHKIIHIGYKSDMEECQLVQSGQQLQKYASCDKGFTHQHLSRHPEQKPYTCITCDKSFRCNSAVIIHQRIHTGQRPYKCTLCNKSFRYKRTMVSHQSIHTGLNPYKCTMCDKSFRHKSSVVKHQNVHSGQRPYKCTTCDKSFVHKTSMVKHQNIHTGLRPYKCTTCDKSFIQKSHLVTHQSIHTGQKPYKCIMCDKSFQYKKSMVSHQNIHTGQQRKQ